MLLAVSANVVHTRMIAMTTFTIATGLVTILAFILQVSGKSTKYTKYISHAVFFFLGLNIGLLINLSTQMEITFPKEWTPRELLGTVLFTATGLLIAILVVMGVLLVDDGQRKAANQSASAISGFLIFLLVFFFSSFFPK